MTVTALVGPGMLPVVADEVVIPVAADVETVPVLNSGDAADDPAIWVHPSAPAESLVIGNDKLGALEVYTLDGVRVQRIVTGTSFWGNVDVRQGVTIDGNTLDLVAAYNAGVRLFAVDGGTPPLQPVGDGTGAVPTGGGEGLCLYENPSTGQVSVFAVRRTGRVQQYNLTDPDGDGLLEGSLVRDFHVGSEAEGCVADDAHQAVYISQEDVGLWRYGANPESGSTRVLIDELAPAGHQSADVEGVAVVDRGAGTGEIIASAQAIGAASYFTIYDRITNEYQRSVRVVDGASADGCSRTDGIEATTADLGPAFPSGMFVCQDNNNFAPGNTGNQNFKLTRLEKLFVPPPPPPPPPEPSEVSFVAASNSNAYRQNHSVQVPATVQEGDTLLLFFTANKNPASTTPPPGWSQLQATDPAGIRGRVWTRTATATDAQTTVTVTNSASSKADLTLAAYRGTPDPPIDVHGLSVDTSSTATHIAPSITPSQPGDWVVVYWADKSSTNTAFSTPAQLTGRSSATGTAGGHLTSALADTNASVPIAPTGTFTATGTAVGGKAVMYTIAIGSTE